MSHDVTCPRFGDEGAPMSRRRPDPLDAFSVPTNGVIFSRKRQNSIFMEMELVHLIKRLRPQELGRLLLKM